MYGFLRREEWRAIVVALDCLNPLLNKKLDLEKRIRNKGGEKERKTKRGKKRKKKFARNMKKMKKYV